MPGKTYKLIELVGVSDISISDAISNAIKKATKSLRNVEWFEVIETRGAVKDDKPVFQVVLKVGFKLEGRPVDWVNLKEID